MAVARVGHVWIADKELVSKRSGIVTWDKKVYQSNKIKSMWCVTKIVDSTLFINHDSHFKFVIYVVKDLKLCKLTWEIILPKLGVLEKLNTVN